MENTFAELVGQNLSDALIKQGISEPTKIQKEAIPKILERQDIIASSETGSGKTLAYLLPIISRLDMEVKQPQAIILTPTHELSAQVFKQIEILSKNMNHQGVIRAALLIGGASLQRQLLSIKQKPHIIIGSAGRILELIDMKKLTSHYVKTIVLDEADKLLDENNCDQTKKVIKTTLRDRQILVFSASIDEKSAHVAREAIGKENIAIISISSKLKIPSNIEHYKFLCEKRDKSKMLRKIIHMNQVKKAIVFVNNPHTIETIAAKLNYHNIKTAALYGSANKSERREALLAFRTGRAVLLVASDMAARGLDISDVTHIINFDAPEEPQTYLHRSGRTGRMGAYGVVYTLATPYDEKLLQKIEKAFSIRISEKNLAFGDAVDFSSKKGYTAKIATSSVMQNKKMDSANKGQFQGGN